jgi:hypothetical protein
MSPRSLPAGFIPPCLPTKAPRPPSGDAWLHEIKHDGFRVIARKDGARVKLYSRPGNDLTDRFPLIVEAVFRHACKMGLEGIVSKRKDSPYKSSRSPHWLKDEEPGMRGGEAGEGRGLRKAMTIINQFLTAGDFWAGMLEPDYDAQLRDPASLRAALHAAISLFHMSDWVFHTHASGVRAAFTFRDAAGLDQRVSSPATFANALEQRNQDFGRVRGICHAGKHLKLTDIRPVPSAPSHSANTRVQAIGFGAGGFGSGPYGLTPRVMLEGAGGADIEFARIAQSVHTMWIDLNGVHAWW